MLYASAPGVLLASSGAVCSLTREKNYEAEPDATWTRLLSSGRIVAIRTGSPGLDYDLSFELGGVPEPIRATVGATARFPFQVAGQRIEVHDGYAALCWGDPDYECERVPFADGDYNVQAVWTPSTAQNCMAIRFYFEETRSFPAACMGFADLLFRSSRA
jgi:hypothetical protein